MKTVRIRLFRRWPPFVKRVLVGMVTVGGFHEIAVAAATKSAQLRIDADRDITGEEIIASLREPEFSLFADCVTVDQKPGYFLSWLSTRNFNALLNASAQTNNWTRLLALLKPGTSARRGGGLMADLQAICKMFPGLDPMTIKREWAMEDFLNFCDSLNRQAASEDPTEDPDAQPMSATALRMMSGAESVN